MDLTLELMRAGNSKDFEALPAANEAYTRRFSDLRIERASFPWGEAEARLTALQQPVMDPAAAAWFSKELGRFLDDLAFDVDARAIDEARAKGQRVYLTLRFAAAELYRLPWELARVRVGSGRHELGELPGCVIRYELPETTTVPPARDRPPEGGRLLFAWAGDVSAAEHLEAIRHAAAEGRRFFGNEHAPFVEDRDVLRDVSIEGLKHALAAPPVAVLHILCHSAPVRHSTTALYGLEWALEGGGNEIVDARTLASVLSPHAGALRLVVLSACNSGNPGAIGSRLGSVAQELHRAGIPAVVASRYPLLMDASEKLTETLYGALLKGLPQADGTTAVPTSLEEAFLAARDRLRLTYPHGIASAALQLYARATDGPDHRPFVVRPYRGLLAFQAEHAGYFFGRQAEIEAAVSGLLKLIAAKKPRLLIVTGASGTGKSSLVFAGVVPALQKRQGDAWEVVSMRPRDGLAGIEAALTTHGEKPGRLLLIVDQFEEIFTDIPESEKETRQGFARRLWALAGDRDARVSVIVTLRVDYLGRCGEITLEEPDLYLERVAYDETHRLFVEKMRHEQLREIVEQPAARAGFTLEEGLATQVITDAGGDEPGALPLVEYTLDQMWQDRSRQGEGYRLTLTSYHALAEIDGKPGGVTGALAKKADAILGRMDEVQRRAARRLLVQLVDSRDDARLDTRQRVRKDDLRRGPADEASVFEKVLETLARERLVVVSGTETKADGKSQPLVEIAHEQLVRSWKTLRQWLEKDREQRLELEPLRAAVKAAKGSKDFVLAGDQLGQARELLKKHEHELDAEARALIERSTRAERRARRRARAAGVAVVLVAAVVGTLAIVAWGQMESKRDTLRMAAAPEFMAHGQPDLAGRLLLDVTDPYKTSGWAELASKVVASGVPFMELSGHGSWVRSAAFSVDSKRVVTASFDKTARVWELDGSSKFLDLKGHTDMVHSATFSPDGKRVVTASFDKTARVWELDGSGKSLDLKGCTSRVTSAAFSHDAKRVVTAFRDKTAQVWELDGSGKSLALKGHLELKGCTDGVSSAEFSHDGKHVVATSGDKTACVWELDGSDIKSRELKGHTDRVVSAAFSPDSERVVTASRDKTARVWELDGSDIKSRELKGHTDSVVSAAFSPDGKRVVTASVDKTARVWELDGFDKSRELKGHTGWINSASFSDDGKRVVTASWDGTARVWELDGSGKSFALKGHTGVVISAAFSPDGKRVVTASRDKTARVWAVDNFGTSRKFSGFDLDGHILFGISASFSADSKRVVTASADKTTRLWELNDFGQSRELSGFDLDDHILNVSSAIFSADGKRVVTTSWDKTARVWELDGSGKFLELKGHAGAVISAAFSHDGKRMVTTSWDKTARVWELDGSGKSFELKGHTDRVDTAEFSPDDKRVVTASWDKTARVWDLDGSGKPFELKGHTDRLNSAAFSSDGKRVVTASWDKTARVWELDSSGNSFELKEHTGDVASAAFSPDGERVVTASSDKTARVWKLDASGKWLEILELKGHADAVLSAAFSPDGKRIVTASSDKTARVWELDGSGRFLELRGHTERVVSAAFIADGKRVVTTSEDKTARVWSVDVPGLQQALHAVSLPCLPPEIHEQYLAETSLEARFRSWHCQRQHRWTAVSALPP